MGEPSLTLVEIAPSFSTSAARADQHVDLRFAEGVCALIGRSNNATRFADFLKRLSLTKGNLYAVLKKRGNSGTGGFLLYSSAFKH
jgi:hypothetical protein